MNGNLKLKLLSSDTKNEKKLDLHVVMYTKTEATESGYKVPCDKIHITCGAECPKSGS